MNRMFLDYMFTLNIKNFLKILKFSKYIYIITLLTIYFLHLSTQSADLNKICMTKTYKEQKNSKFSIGFSGIKREPMNLESSPYKNALYIQKSKDENSTNQEICEKRKKVTPKINISNGTENSLKDIIIEKIPKA